MTREERLSALGKVPSLAAVDHRYFLDKEGHDVRLKKTSRHFRRKIQAQARKISERYKQVLLGLYHGGKKYPVDKFLRSLAIEYTHRYASSGLMTQPASFNYFEPFCEIKLIEQSTAPYASIRHECDHLFSVPDFFDYLTSQEKADFKTQDLMKLPEGMIHHFTQNGGLGDFSYMNARGKEFLISGLSMIRHGASLHWYLVGGEVLSESELEEAKSEKADEVLDVADIPAFKRRFLSEAADKGGKHPGLPVMLEGSKNALRTIIGGEFDIITGKHLVRLYMRETENMFMIHTDDPDVLDCIKDKAKRDHLFENMKSELEEAAILWDLAEGFFQLPNYFQFRLTVPEAVVNASGLPKPKATRGGRGITADFRHVASIEVSDKAPSILMSYSSTPYPVETEGYWHRLAQDSFGSDREGKPVQGRDWIKADVTWRTQPVDSKIVFIKSTVSSAKLAIADYLKAAEEVAKRDARIDGDAGVLYVMRCMAMQDEVYKVGWTSKTAHDRAKELSTTGVPVPFEVVAAWKHKDAAALERSVHAMLDPYRIAGNREFFRTSYPVIQAIVEQEIARGTA